MRVSYPHFLFFFFNDTATTEIYTLSLHDALPISQAELPHTKKGTSAPRSSAMRCSSRRVRDRKSTRLNSSHGYISYAVFCLKKKKTEEADDTYSYRLEYTEDRPTQTVIQTLLRLC